MSLWKNFVSWESYVKEWRCGMCSFETDEDSVIEAHWEAEHATPIRHARAAKAVDEAYERNRNYP